MDNPSNTESLYFVIQYALFIFPAIAAIVSLRYILLDKWRNFRKYKLPPGPTGLPILGYLPFLGKEAYRDLDLLSRKYGNVFSLYLGQTFVVILGDYEAVKEAFSKSSTTDRPESIFDFMPDGVGFSSVNGEEWIEQRKFAVKAMRDIGLGKSKWEKLVQEEVEEFVKLMYSFEGQPTNIARPLTASVSNNIASLVFGKRVSQYEEDADFLCSSFDSIYKFLTQTGWRIYFPAIIDALTKLGLSQHTKTRKVFVDFNNYIRKEVELQKQTHVPGNTSSFVHEYLTEMENYRAKNMETTFNDVNLRGNVQAIFLGGSDTTRTSLMWLLLCMAKYPSIQETVHCELDSVLGKDGKILWSSRYLVPYTVAVILEGQRWRTIAPLNTSRIATEDITVGGFDVPKGSTIIANNWGLHHDTKYWTKPEKFMPERFLMENNEVNYKPDSYVPFSYGKRNCPAEAVGMIEILCYFTAIMQNFNVLPPENEEPSMDGVLGLTFQPHSQKLRFVPRT